MDHLEHLLSRSDFDLEFCQISFVHSKKSIQIDLMLVEDGQPLLLLHRIEQLFQILVLRRRLTRSRNDLDDLPLFTCQNDSIVIGIVAQIWIPVVVNKSEQCQFMSIDTGDECRCHAEIVT